MIDWCLMLCAIVAALAVLDRPRLPEEYEGPP